MNFSLCSLVALGFLFAGCGSSSGSDASDDSSPDGGTSSGELPAGVTESPASDPGESALATVTIQVISNGNLEVSGSFPGADYPDVDVVGPDGAILIGERIKRDQKRIAEPGDLLTIRSAGKGTVPAFEAHARVPYPITVTAPAWLAGEAPVGELPEGPLELAWTYAGNDDGVTITVNATRSDGAPISEPYTEHVLAKDGAFTIAADAIDAFRSLSDVHLGVYSRRVRAVEVGNRPPETVKIDLVGEMRGWSFVDAD